MIAAPAAAPAPLKSPREKSVQAALQSTTTCGIVPIMTTARPRRHRDFVCIVTLHPFLPHGANPAHSVAPSGDCPSAGYYSKSRAKAVISESERQVARRSGYSESVQTAPHSSTWTWITFGWQQTGQFSTYECCRPADRSTGMTICSPKDGQTYRASSRIVAAPLAHARRVVRSTWLSRGIRAGSFSSLFPKPGSAPNEIAARWASGTLLTSMTGTAAPAGSPRRERISSMSDEPSSSRMRLTRMRS